MNTVFYTEISIPHNATHVAVMKLVDDLRVLRSVTLVRILTPENAIRIVVSGSHRTVRHSDCPLPGTHEFAAGWIAHEAMMAVSCMFEQPTAWVEGEVRSEELRLPGHDPVMYPVTRYRRDRPPVMIDYKGFLADNGSLSVKEQPSPFSQGGQITGPGRP